MLKHYSHNHFTGKKTEKKKVRSLGEHISKSLAVIEPTFIQSRRRSDSSMEDKETFSKLKCPFIPTALSLQSSFL